MNTGPFVITTGVPGKPTPSHMNTGPFVITPGVSSTYPLPVPGLLTHITHSLRYFGFLDVWSGLPFPVV